MFNVTQDLPISPVGAHVGPQGVDTAHSVTVPAKAKRLFMSVAAQNVRITFDGTAATTTKGLVFPAADETKIIDVAEGVQLSIIGVAAGGTINYQFSR